MRYVMLMIMLLLAGCSCSSGGQGAGQPQRHDEGLGDIVMEFIGPQKAYANGDATYEIPGNPVIIYDPTTGESAPRVFMGVYEDTFPAHLPASTNLTYYGWCFHNDTVDDTNDGIYWSNGSTWTGPLGTGDVGGAGSWADNQDIRGDGTTGIQGAPDWSTDDNGKRTGSGSQYDIVLDPDATSAPIELVQSGNSFPQTEITGGLMRFGSGGSAVDTSIRRWSDGVVALRGDAAGGQLRFVEDFGVDENYFQIGSASSRTTDQTVYWPDDTPSDGDFLEWNTGGQLEWTAAGGGSSPLTTKGDLYTYDTGDQRLAVGTNNYALTPDSAQSTGLKWAVPFTLQGDLGTPQNLLIGDAIDIAGGTGISTTGGSPDTVTVNLSANLADLGDADDTGVADGDHLVYNSSGGEWRDQKTYYNTSFTSSGWTLLGGNLYYQTFTHNLGNTYVTAQVYDSSGYQQVVNPAASSTGDIQFIRLTGANTLMLVIYNGNSIPGTWNLVCTR